MINQLNALALLQECRGDEIWSLEHCENAGVPMEWVEQLAACFESGFDRQTNLIYEQTGLTNQYHGIRDLDLAYRIAEYLGYNCDSIRSLVFDRRRQVHAIKQMIEEE